MIARVKAIAAKGGQIDAPDKGDLAVHDHQLLVVAMHRPLARIERTLNAGTAKQLLAHVAHGPAGGFEDGERCSTPQQHPHLDSLGEITEQIAQPRRLTIARQPEIRRDMPPGDMHMRPSAPQRVGDLRQRLRSVDQDLELAPRAWRRVPSDPQRRLTRGIQLVDPADTPQPAAVMRSDRGLDAPTCPPIDALDQVTRH
jgi:hypothetical protein